MIRRLAFRAAATFVLLAAVACGSAPTAPTPVASAPRLSLTRFLAFGDSITAGEVTVPIAGGSLVTAPLVLVESASYPTVLQAQLVGRYASQAQQVAVINAGKPGEAAIDAVPRLLDVMPAEKPEVVLLLAGFNDLLGRREAAIVPAADAMRAMAVEAKARGARVFLATVTPNRPDRNRTIPASVLVAYNDRMRSLAAAEGAVLVDLYAALLGSADTYIGIDGLHPTEAGYRKIAETFFTAIQGALETR